MYVYCTYIVCMNVMEINFGVAILNCNTYE